MENFLSYRSAVLHFSDFTALVGPNGSGKSNAVAAIKLLRDIPTHGLPAAIARRGGFDQLRHRSSGRPHDPALRIEFSLDGQHKSFYELRLSPIAGKRYEIKLERSLILSNDREFGFENNRGRLTWFDNAYGRTAGSSSFEREIELPPGQSALSLAGTIAAYVTGDTLQSVQTLEISPARLGDLQEPSPTHEFEPDGSNIASIAEDMPPHRRTELAELLAAIVPGVVGVEVRHVADKVTVAFAQDTGHGRREFFAKQMSDGTLRIFGILVAMLQEPRPQLLVIEEPEVAVHLGALQTLVEVLRAQTDQAQIVITTHSADIVDSLTIDDLRVVWSEDGVSKIATVAEHTRDPVRRGLITTGALLRADALDPSA